MMSEIPNLWGQLDVEQYTQNPIKSPSTILKRQATLIGQMTKGLILGEVISADYKPLEYKPSLAEQIVDNTIDHLKQPLEKSLPFSGEQSFSVDNPNDNQNHNFSQILRFKVPNLNNYTYSLLQIIYPITNFYPLVVYRLLDDSNPINCKDEKQFLATLEKILASEEVHHVIHVLLSQIN